MEEKKKRWRPSLGAYRALQREVEDQMEMKSKVIAESRLWREKYRQLLKDSGNVKTLRDHIDALENENQTLLRKNKLVDHRYGELTSRLAELGNENIALRERIDVILSRSLMERILNRDF